jgi:peptide alpha-N-acetyltransferase
MYGYLFIFCYSVHDIEKKYYADGEDALAMRLNLKEPKPIIRGIVEEVNQVAATVAAKVADVVAN